MFANQRKIYRAPPNSGKLILGRTVPSLLEEGCDRTPNTSAFNHWRGRGWETLSNQAFQAGVEEFALSLWDLGLEKGDRVALLMHSDVNFCIADMACLLGGLVDVPIDITQTIEHIIFMVRHPEAKVLIVSNLDLLVQIVPYLWDVPNLQAVIVADVPENWEEIRRERLTCQLHGKHNKHEEIPGELCLQIPEFGLPEGFAGTCPEFPPCIQVFSLEEIGGGGRG